MSYQVLARKYRPAVFSEMVGQQHVLQALINALDQNRLHHAYLFTGTRGVGKTTIARILAKCLNCEAGLTSIPCGECASCREISEGRSIDLIEVDAASRTGVDDTRELLENVQYMPTRSRYKVYLIDEVHMFSKSSFNALLKTLEEPPEHVKFLLATTDPKKLPVTVLSRCLQLNLRNMTPENIVGYLQSVLASENVDYEESALWQLGRAAEGSMRDALSLTDQAIAYGKGFVADKDVLDMLGGVDQREIHHLLQDLIDDDAAQLLDHIRNVAQYSPDFSRILADFLSLLHRIAIAKAVPDTVDNSQGDRESVIGLAAGLTPEDLHLYYQIGLIGQRDLLLAPDIQSGFEMTMLRMLAFRPHSAEANRESGRQTSAGTTIENPLAEKSTDQHQNSEPPKKNTESKGSTHSADHEKQAEIVRGSELQADHITRMLATINGDAAGSDKIKKPDPDYQREEPERSTKESILSAAGVHDNEQVPASGPETVGEYQQSYTDTPDHAEIGDAVQLTPQHDADQIAATTEKNKEVKGEDSSHAKTELPVNQVNEANAEESALPTELDHSPDTDSRTINAEGGENASIDWAQLLPQLELSGVAYNLASNCILQKAETNLYHLRLHELHASLWNKNYQARIGRALSELHNRTVEVEITLGELDAETPAQYQARIEQEQVDRAIVTIQEDENVKQLVKDFDAKLVLESVRPIHGQTN